jgi:hypothetical protein
MVAADAEAAVAAMAVAAGVIGIVAEIATNANPAGNKNKKGNGNNRSPFYFSRDPLRSAGVLARLVVLIALNRSPFH